MREHPSSDEDPSAYAHDAFARRPARQLASSDARRRPPLFPDYIKGCLWTTRSSTWCAARTSISPLASRRRAASPPGETASPKGRDIRSVCTWPNETRGRSHDRRS